MGKVDAIALNSLSAYVGHRGHAFRCIVITQVGDLSRSEAT